MTVRPLLAMAAVALAADAASAQVRRPISGPVIVQQPTFTPAPFVRPQSLPYATPFVPNINPFPATTVGRVVDPFTGVVTDYGTATNPFTGTTKEVSTSVDPFTGRTVNRTALSNPLNGRLSETIRTDPLTGEVSRTTKFQPPLLQNPLFPNNPFGR